jgi:hypothetical protein
MVKKYLSTIQPMAMVFILLTAALALTTSCQNKVSGNDKDEDPLGFTKKDSITLQLEEIKVLFPTVEQWEEKGAIIFRSDTAIIYDRNSEMLLEKSFTINIDVTKQITVEQQYETTLSIIHPNGDIKLDKLNKYTSPWIPITTQAGNNKFNKPAFTPEEIRQFPETPIDQVLEYLFWVTRTTQSEFDWTKYLKQARSIQDFPFDIRISKITFRIKGIYITGKPFTKYIVFYLG